MGIDLAGLVGGGEEGFTQQRVAGFGESMLVFGLSGLAELGNETRIGADRGQGMKSVRVADAAGDDGARDGPDTGC